MNPSSSAPARGDGVDVVERTRGRDRDDVVTRAALAASVGFGLVVHRRELTVVSDLNDTALHASMVRLVVERLQAGEGPFGGWYPSLGLGFPQFDQYQSLPHVLTALLGTVVGGDLAVRLVAYVLLALWPLSVYAGTRLVGLDRVAGAVAALAAPLLVSAPGYGYEQASYTWQGFGAWTQLWGMLLLPLAWGLGWRAVDGRRGSAIAALTLGLTLASHVLTGSLAVVGLGVWVVARPTAMLQRALRAAVVGIGGLAVASFVIVPALLDATWANYAGFERGTFYYDSFGPRRVLGWLVTGSLFDEGRLPVVTSLVAVGLVVSVARWRSDGAVRPPLAAFVVSLLLFFGRPTLGPLLDLVPGGDDLFLHRFIVGVHLAGLVLAGVGGAALARHVLTGLGRLPAGPRRLVATRPAVLVVGLALLAPAWRERADDAATGARLIEAQLLADRGDGRDVAELLDVVRDRGDGRVHPGLSSGAGRAYRVGYVPVYAMALNQDVEAVGFALRVSSLTTAFEPGFDAADLDHHRMFGVRYLLLPRDDEPAVAATAIATRGRHRLWEVEGATGYFDVVSPAPPLVADRTSLAVRVGPMLSAPEGADRRPTVVFDGDASTAVAPDPDETPPGTVTPILAQPARGRFAARASLSRPGVVVLAASFHGRWEVRVDGAETDALLVAPSMVGAAVPAGEHTVSFRYRSFPATPWLLAVGAAGIGVIALVPRRRRGGVVPEHRTPSVVDQTIA